MPTPDQSLLTAALHGYEHHLAVLNERIAAVREALAGIQPARPTSTARSAAAPRKAGPKPAKRAMSAEGRARIAAAARKRWRDARRRGVNPITGKRLPK